MKAEPNAPESHLQRLRQVGEGILRSLVRPIVPGFNRFLGLFVDNRPHFENNPFPQLDPDFKDNWREIRAEFQDFLRSQECPRMTDFLEGEARIGGDQWRVAFLRFLCRDIEPNRHHFPMTMKLVKEHPEIMSAFFSVLPPGKRLQPHCGAYKGLLRYHLGLIVPQDSSSCGITVDGQTRHWQEGERFVFDDTFLHHAWNDSEEFRAILILDVKRELPWFLNLVHYGVVFLTSRIVFPWLGTYHKMSIPKSDTP